MRKCAEMSHTPASELRRGQVCADTHKQTGKCVCLYFYSDVFALGYNKRENNLLNNGKHQSHVLPGWGPGSSWRPPPSLSNAQRPQHPTLWVCCLWASICIWLSNSSSRLFFLFFLKRNFKSNAPKKMMILFYQKDFFCLGKIILPARVEGLKLSFMAFSWLRQRLWFHQGRERTE